MKLMICIVQNRYRTAMEDGLKNSDYRMTELASSGGFLKKGNTTFLIGINDGEEKKLTELMKEICLNYETKKGKSREQGGRFTSFLINSNDTLPYLKNLT